MGLISTVAAVVAVGRCARLVIEAIGIEETLSPGMTTVYRAGDIVGYPCVATQLVGVIGPIVIAG